MSERAVKTLFSMLMVCTMQIVSSDESFKSLSILTFRSPKQKLHSVFSKKKKKEERNQCSVVVVVVEVQEVEEVEKELVESMTLTKETVRVSLLANVANVA